MKPKFAAPPLLYLIINYSVDTRQVYLFQEQNLNKDQQHEENKAASIDTKFFLCITTFKYKDKLMQHLV